MAEKSVLVTGAGSGFGKLTTDRLLQRGHRVVAAIRGGEERLRATFGDHPKLSCVDLELTDFASITAAAQSVQRQLDGRLDVLINNAGYCCLGPLELQKPEEVIRQFQVNAIGPLALTRELLPALRATRGRVLNLTSLAGITVFPFYGTYAATKYAMHALSEAMYYELKPFGIQVAAIEPGGYRTGLMRNARFGDSTHPHAALYSDRLRRFDGFLKHVQDHIEKDPEVVAQTLVSLTEKSRIRPRYLVGGEAVANGILRRLTPDRVFLPIQDWIYRKFFF